MLSQFCGADRIIQELQLFFLKLLHKDNCNFQDALISSSFDQQAFAGYFYFWTSERVWPILCLFQMKLNNGEACLSAAHPYDVATLVKQFCRELPEPLFPSELQPALLKSQTLPNAKDKTSALQLLSCLLPARSSSCLHYLFSFLSRISQRFAVYVKHRVFVQNKTEMMSFVPQVRRKPDDQLEPRYHLCTMSFTSSQQGRNV